MPAPVLELTQAMVGPQRTELTVAYLQAAMQWPDDPVGRRDVMKTAHALQMRETLRNVPAAREALALQAFEAGFEAKSSEEIRQAGGDRYYQGCLAGEFVLRALLIDELGRTEDGRASPVKLESIKAAMTSPAVRALHRKRDVSRSTLDNKIIPRFRPVAHLWAAYVFEAKYYGRQAFPCTLERVPWFLWAAESLRERAVTLKQPRRPGSRRNTLLSANEAWVLPRDLMLPCGDAELVFDGANLVWSKPPFDLSTPP
jgi:hypothetical protein